MLRSRAVAALIALSLISPLAHTQNAADANRGQQLQALHGQLQDLDQALQQPHRTGRAPAAGQHRVGEMSGLRARLIHLQRLAGAMPAAERQALLGKIERLQRLAAGQPATEDGKAALPAAFAAGATVHSTRKAGEKAPGNDSCSAARAVSDGTWVGSTADAANDGHASCGASYLSPDVWFRYTASSTGLVGANTLGSDYDTVLSVHESCPGNVKQEIACNDDTHGLQSAVGFTAEAGEEYLIRVSGFGTATGTFMLTLGPAAAISGTVGQSGNMRPIADVTVEVYDEDGSLAGSSITDESGFYRVDGLRTGTYFAATKQDGDRIDQLYDGLSCPGGAGSGCDPLSGTPIVTLIGTVSSGIDLGLPPGGTISGTVTETGSGVPVAGAEVTVFDRDGEAVSTGLSNLSGRYSAGGLLTGSYTVVASHPELAGQLHDGLPCPGGAPTGCDPTGGTAVAVITGGTTAGIDFALDRVGAISGRVSELTSGAPVAGWVEVWTASGSFVKSTATGTGGTWLLGGLDSGSYLVIAGSDLHVDELYNNIACEDGCDLASATPITVVDGTTTSGIDLVLQRLGALSGTVTENATGSPIASAVVVVRDVYSRTLYYVYTDSDGSYAVPGLATDYYTAIVSAWEDYVDEYYDDLPCDPDCEASDASPIPVANGAVTTGIDFGLDTQGRISGTVTDSDGNPIPDVQVEIRTSANLLESTRTDEQGMYTAIVWMSGGYYVLTESRYLDELYDDVPCEGGPGSGCSLSSGKTVRVDNGVTITGIDFVLEPDDPTGISGTVRDATTGSPVSNALVWIWDDTGSEVTITSTGESGLYKVHGLAPGDYFLSVRIDGFADELYDDIPCPLCDPTTGTPVSVSAGSVTRHVDFLLGQGGVITGRAYDDATGEPASTRVSVWNLQRQRVASVYGDWDGSYRVPDLPSGSYYLSFEGRDKHLGELYDDVPCQYGPPYSCSWSQGTVITVTAGQTTGGIDAALVSTGTGILSSVKSSAGEPIAGVYIDVWDAVSGRRATTAVTSPEGSCLAALPAGSYRVSTHNTFGYHDQVYDGRSCPNGSAFSGACDPSSGEEVAVLTGQITGGVDFVLGATLFSNGFESGDTSAWPVVVPPPARGGEGEGAQQGSGVISGTVTDALSSAPIDGVMLELSDAGGVPLQSVPSVAGDFVFPYLPAGTYHLLATHSQYRDELYDDIPWGSSMLRVVHGTPITIADGEWADDIDLVLEPLGGISGLLSNRVSGEPISNVSVYLFDSRGQQVESARSDADGIYEVALAAGTYTAVAGRSEWAGRVYDDIPCDPTCRWLGGTPITVQAGVITTGIDFALDRLGSITGTVSAAATGDPIVNLRVEVWRFGDSEPVAEDSSDALGVYLINGLESGDYFVVTSGAPGNLVDELYDDLPCYYWHSKHFCTPSAGSPVQVSRNTSTSGIDFALDPGGIISGTVSDAVTGEMLEGAAVSFFDAEGSPVGGVYSQADGTWQRSGLTGGTFYIVVLTGGGYQRTLYEGIPCAGIVSFDPLCDPTTGTPITVVRGETTGGIDIALQPYGVISGVVRDSSTGLPVPGARVEIYAGSDPSKVWTTASGSGLYTSRPLPAGTYYALAYSDRHAYQLYEGLPVCRGCYPTTGTPIVVEPGATLRSIDFNLIAMNGGVITGRVYDDRTGNPLRYVSVFGYDTSGEWAFVASTDAQGVYDSGELEAGTYFATTQGAGYGYLDELYSNLPESSEPTKGTPVVVSAGSTVQVDFGLHFAGSGIAASVHAADSGEPLEGVLIDIWDAATGVQLGTVATGASGAVLARLSAGSYLLTTDNGRGFVDQVYDGVQCPDGPAYSGACDATSGSPVVVVDDEVTEGVSFLLEPPYLFRDGFESGDTSVWSVTTAGP